MTAATASDRGQQCPPLGENKEDTHVQPLSGYPYPFPRIDDPPPDLNEILSKLTDQTGQPDSSDESDKEARFPNKPWLAWPKTLEDIRLSEPQRQLYGYLSNRKLLAQRTKQIREQFYSCAAANGLTSYEENAGEQQQHTGVLLGGGTSDDWSYYSSDTSKDVFRQDPFFRYLFGVNEPDLYGLIDFQRKEAVLFYPAVPADARRFNGEMRTPEWYREKYGLDKAIIYEDAASSLNDEIEIRGIDKIFVLRGTNSDSGRNATPPHVATKLKIPVDDGPLLHTTLCASRVYKVPLEVAHMRAACLASSQAHVFVMSHLREGMIELHAEDLFKSFVGHAGAARHVAYTCICCAGENGATLHYGHAGRPNDERIESGDMMLLDMGGEYQGYATDITASFPISGTFTRQQRIIYEAVYHAQKQVEKKMKPGAFWPVLHRQAEKVILQHLIDAGILQGTVRECMRARLGSVFMPHGLGHFLGLDTHDVGGFINASRSDEEGLRYLRTTRKLEKNMIITVEPGCYFIPAMLQEAITNPQKNKLINCDVLETYMEMGGVRLEDCVLVTDNGILNLTVLPRRVEDVEEVLACRDGNASSSTKRTDAE